MTEGSTGKQKGKRAQKAKRNERGWRDVKKKEKPKQYVKVSRWM